MHMHCQLNLIGGVWMRTLTHRPKKGLSQSYMAREHLKNNMWQLVSEGDGNGSGLTLCSSVQFNA